MIPNQIEYTETSKYYFFSADFLLLVGRSGRLRDVDKTSASCDADLGDTMTFTVTSSS